MNNEITKNNKTLAIIIPNYNKAAFIGKTLTSIVNQSFLPSEIIIIDDDSTDDSKRVVGEFVTMYPDLIKVFFLSSNHGVQYCRNLGIQKSSSEYICFVDSDDVYLDQNCLEKQMTIANPNVLVGVYQLTIDDNDNITSFPYSKRIKKQFAKRYIYNMMKLDNFMLWPHFYIVSRDKVIKVGMFDYPYNLYEDADMYFKLIFSGIKIKWVNIEGKGYRTNPNDKNHLSHAALEEHKSAKTMLIKKNRDSLSFVKLFVYSFFDSISSIKATFITIFKKIIRHK